MYFTLLFETNYGPTEIYELCFHPAVVWMKDGEDFCQPHRGPYFVAGDFTFLVQHAKISSQATNDNGHNPRPRKVSIVCHHTEEGREEDLNLLIAEMKSEGFIPQLMVGN